MAGGSKLKSTVRTRLTSSSGGSSRSTNVVPPASCGTCKKAIDDDSQSSIECESCIHWYHINCVDVPEEVIDHLKVPGLHWLCPKCESQNQKTSSLERKIEELTELVSRDIEPKFNMLERSYAEAVKQIESNSEKLTSKIGESLKKDYPQLAPSNENIPKNTAAVVSELAGEMKEREKRLLNVVFSGADTKERVGSFVAKSGLKEPTKISEISTPNKRKLFIVTMQEEIEKWTLIGKARKISSANDEFQGVYVNPDLTKTERDVQFKLREEVRRRRALGENVKISKGRVVTIDS